MKYYWAIKKERKIYPYDTMDASEENYAKWNEPVRERQAAHDFTHVWNLMNKLTNLSKW